MSTPCEKAEDITKIKDTITSMVNNGGRLEEALTRMVSAQERQSAELRDLAMTITTHMLDNREFRMSLDRGKEERDLIFRDLRTHSRRIDDISKFQSKLVGGLFVVPSVCTVISVLLALYVAMRGI